MKPTALALVLVSLMLNAFFAVKSWLGPPEVRVANSVSDLIVMRTPGGLLEVSTIAAEERFDSTTSHTVLGVPVGKTVAQIRVPAVYRYHIPLQTEWKIRVLGETLVVVAPKVQASLPVAVDTGKLETFTSGLWSPITGTDAVAALQKSITSTLGKKAASEQLVLLQRESARRTVSEFVQKWVVSQSRWKNGKAPTVLVFFEDEPLGKKAVPLVASPPQ